jgi:hypothetical protein
MKNEDDNRKKFNICSQIRVLLLLGVFCVHFNSCTLIRIRNPSNIRGMTHILITTISIEWRPTRDILVLNRKCDVTRHVSFVLRILRAFAEVQCRKSAKSLWL